MNEGDQVTVIAADGEHFPGTALGHDMNGVIVEVFGTPPVVTYFPWAGVRRIELETVTKEYLDSKEEDV